ncbi:ribonuclease HII [Candidatus Parcubacteria bacterium]|jgi:ribonuclease HII|nr:MAG: ribonuclease HII [Candidatus Parcubacteria bacterium]
MRKKPPLNKHEKKLRKAGHQLIAGVDEAGKGSWAGPLVAAAVILDHQNLPKNIFDSKMLKSHQREKAFVEITKKSISWSAHLVPAKKIDEQGIQKANLEALTMAVKKLHIQPQAILVDAFKIFYGRKPVVNIINGDALERSIGAASIIAKVIRDRLMSSEIHHAHPQYKFDTHKGYGTSLHKRLLLKHGSSPEHRHSFSPMKDMLKKKTIAHKKIRRAGAKKNLKRIKTRRK